jgi:molybdate transport system substrate-binding protein
MLRVLFILALMMPLVAKAAPDGLTVFAAASLTDALTDIGRLWQAQGHRISFDFDASSTLARQIESGAQADIFASADELWMDRLATENRIRRDTRVDLLSNTLVLVERRSSMKPLTLKRGVDLGAILGADGRLAVGNTASVPAGIYARQALQSLGMWEGVQNRLAPAESVRSALLLVARGEAPAGIVYGTDARVDPHLAIAGTFPADSHDPIRYPVALTATAQRREAAAFLAFLHTQPAQDVFRHYGFLPP